MRFTYLPPSEAKRGVLESTSKRVRMIFSVMASPNRIDILRILNNKGPLTYSELKSLAGFKSKKESGKFAYHLRKLLKQSLVGLNKAERRYTITNLGKLVLNLARQIEEKSIVESGKMYVRTSHQTIEEFNSHKIIQSLVKEANMSLEQATKITEEVENKIYKLSTSYLTSRLIRDCVNNVLLDHGLEEQMNKLTRVGVPIFDLNRKLNNNNNNAAFKNGINDLVIGLSQDVLSDYFACNFQKDIMDMHYSGEIHLDALGSWTIGLDTVFIDVEQFKKDLSLKGSFLLLPRTPNIENFDLILPVIISLLQREVSSEIVIENVGKIFIDYQLDTVSKYFSLSLISSTLSMQSANLPSITIVVSGKESSELLLELLKGYLMYVENVALPHFRLLINHAKALSNDILFLVGKIVKRGGNISLSQQSVLSSKGIRRMNTNTGLPVVVLNSLSINLPRLAYQSNKDETYFRTKLALIMKPATSTLILKHETLLDNIRQEILPTISKVFHFPQTGSTSIVVNLTGLNESIYDILGYSEDTGFDIIKKVIKTANDVLFSYNQTNSRFGISLINDSSSTRFVTLDSNKFGKLTHDFLSYSQGITITKKLLEGGNTITERVNELVKLVTGGLYIKFDVTGISQEELTDLLHRTINTIPHFEIFEKHAICSACGKRDIKDNVCLSCGSSNIVEIN